MIDTLKPWLAWGAGGAVLAGLIALAVMNPIAAARLASAASGWLLDTGRSVVTWARDPERNWWKIGCFAFAGFFTLAAMIANEQRQQVVATVAACEVTVQGVKTELNGRLSELVRAQGNFLVCQKALEREVGLPALVAELNAAAVVKAQAQAKAAQRELADFKKRYGAKPATCTAALAEVEKQCASLSDY